MMTTDEKSNWTNEEPESRNHYLRFECARVICSRQKIFHQKMCYECLLGSYHIHSRAHFMNIAQYLLTFLSHRMITGLMMQVLKRIFILIITTSSNVPMPIKYFISQILLMMFAFENGRTKMLFLTQSIQSTALHPDFLCLYVCGCVCVCVRWRFIQTIISVCDISYFQSKICPTAITRNRFSVQFIPFLTSTSNICRCISNESIDFNRSHLMGLLHGKYSNETRPQLIWVIRM